ncbi:vesicle-trafficking protein SEC22c [Coregonus clupeaformis]|uniref:vesicle-trafficking protein SEC22c n=1 Tax=Coregonus clupeaformis TaxID=59861 RepID=UPI001E1C271F|nr:vesicle-trafficking protein SEC22c [Coregonus clupeaformis]
MQIKGRPTASFWRRVYGEWRRTISFQATGPSLGNWVKAMWTMSLILFALVVRVRDGLPLSASTDFQHNPELQEKKQQLRTISKTLSLFPDRGAVKGHDLNIYFLSSEGVSYMSVCDASLPAAMAFCFLEDLRWDFTAHMDSAKVALAARPYPFLEFDNSIAWLQQQYNVILKPVGSHSPNHLVASKVEV